MNIWLLVLYLQFMQDFFSSNRFGPNMSQLSWIYTGCMLFKCIYLIEIVTVYHEFCEYTSQSVLGYVYSLDKKIDIVLLHFYIDLFS